MSLRKIVFSEEECEKWKRDPTRNPKTNRKIDPNAKTGIYQRLLRQCGSPFSLPFISKRFELPKLESINCEEWRRNPTKDPRTGDEIDIETDRYRELVRECGSPFAQLRPVLPEITKIERTETLPLIIETPRNRSLLYIDLTQDRTFYIISIINGRRVLLGYIPAEITQDDTDDERYTSKEIIEGIIELWNRGRLSRTDRFITRITEWFDEEGEIRLDLFIEIADRIYDQLR